jgi:(p)ppGpp synthase/HD superfamily hydrolase
MPGRSWIPTFVENRPLSRSAAAYAAQMHAGQRRGDGAPFILHPIEVASLLHHAGAPEHLIAAGLIHDLVEKTDAEPSDLRMRFGSQITDLVLAVSEDDRITGQAARKAALRRQVADAGVEALTLFAADKLSKLRELRRETSPDSGTTAATRRARELHYRRSVALLERRIPDSPLVRELQDELSALGREQVLLAAAG